MHIRIEKIMMALSTLVLKTVMERNHEDLHGKRREVVNVENMFIED
jgi:hypothetical protein